MLPDDILNCTASIAAVTLQYPATLLSTEYSDAL
jgi:hypothetical protein